MAPLYLLPGFADDRRGTAASTALLAAVFLSRVLLLPDGPWEQDEALFASGVESFDVLRHRPHPPGFVGWIAIGKLLAPLTGDGLLALRLAASIASTLLFALTAQLLTLWDDRRSPWAAMLAALAFSLSPLVWVHAPRAFSTTPALACLAGALWLWTRTHHPQHPNHHAYLGGWLALGLALTLRPQLAPEAALIAGYGLTRPSVSLRHRAAGVGLAAAVVGAAVLATWASAPSWSQLATSFADHLGTHRGGMERPLRWSELGVVRGLGHPAVAGAVLFAAVVGVIVRMRRDPRAAAWWLAVVAVTTWMLLRVHHPGFPRYAVALLLVALPFVVSGVSVLPPRWRTGVWLAAAVAGGLEALGSLFAMRAAPLPAIAAVRHASADPRASALAYSHGLFSLARFEGERSGLARVDVHDLEQPPALGPAAYALAGRTLRFVDGLTACTVEIPPAPAAAMRLSQGRFGAARLARDPVLLGAGVHAPEPDEHGEWFAWLAGEPTFVVPAGAEALVLQLHTPPGWGPQRVRATGPHARLEDHPLPAGRSTLSLPLTGCDAGCDVHLQFEHTRLEGDDTRPLSVQLDAAWVTGDSYRPAATRWSPGLPRSLRAADVRLEGLQPPEKFGSTWGAWTGATAHASFPAQPGTLTLRVARPQHSPGAVTIATDAETQTVELPATITRVQLRTEAPRGRATLSWASPTFTPASVRSGSADTRTLGLIVYDVTFTPDGDACTTAPGASE